MMSARTALLLAALWAVSLGWTYRFAQTNEHNAVEATKVPALVQVIAEHDVKADAGNKVEKVVEVKAARTDSNFQKIEREVIDYVQTHPVAADCSIDSVGMRVWRAANANTDPEASPEAGGEADAEMPGAAPAEDGPDAGSAGQPRTGGEALPQVPGEPRRAG